MSRLIDDLKYPIPYAPVQVQNWIPEAVVFQIQNVADYHFSEPKAGYTWADFPNMAPPYPVAWYEYFQPRLIAHPDGTVSEIPQDLVGSRVGVLVNSARLENEEDLEVMRKEADKEDYTWMRDTVYAATVPGWLSIFALFYNQRADVRPWYVGGFMLAINSEGIGGPNKLAVGFGSRMTAAQPDAAEMVISAVRPAALATSFLHCRNVQVVERAAEERLQKRRVHEGKPPLVKFHTLNIEPMRRVLRTEGQSEKTGIKRSLHICRGYFADYTKGRGLFGKHKGIYWFDWKLRGTVQAGVTLKDYAVGTGDAT